MIHVRLIDWQQSSKDQDSWDSLPCVLEIQICNDYVYMHDIYMGSRCKVYADELRFLMRHICINKVISVFVQRTK